MHWRSHGPRRSPSLVQGAPPAHLKHRIDELRSRLRGKCDLAELYADFDAHVARDLELFDSSEDREDDGLVAVVSRASAKVHPGFQPITFALFEVRGTGFWHGVVSGNHALSCFFYDERSTLGVAAVCSPVEGSDRTRFARFSTLRAAVDPVPDSMLDRILGQ